MLTPQSRQVVVPAKLQWLRVWPMTAQSSFVPVIEYGIVEVRVAPFFLLLRLRLGTVSPHRFCAISSSLNPSGLKYIGLLPVESSIHLQPIALPALSPPDLAHGRCKPNPGKTGGLLCGKEDRQLLSQRVLSSPRKRAVGTLLEDDPLPHHFRFFAACVGGQSFLHLPKSILACLTSLWLTGEAIHGIMYIDLNSPPWQQKRHSKPLCCHSVTNSTTRTVSFMF